MTTAEHAISASLAEVKPLAVAAHGQPKRCVRGFDASNPAGFAGGFGRGRR